MKCINHPGIDAIGICTKCGKAICADCTIDNGVLICKPCADKLDAARPEKATSTSTKPVYLEKSNDFPDSPFAPCMASLIIPGLGLFMILPDRNKLAPFLQIFIGLVIDLLFIFTVTVGLTYSLTGANLGLSDYMTVCCLPLIVIPVYHFCMLAYTYAIWQQLKQGIYKGMPF